MGLNDILVVLDGSAQAAPSYALSLAKITGAEVTAVSPVAEPNLAYVSAEIPSDILTQVHDEAEREAGVALAHMAELARETGVPVRQRLVEASSGDTAQAVGTIARFYDLTVMDQGDPDKGGSFEITESVLFGSGRPVLVVPFFFKPPVRIKTALVAWDGSRPAARALGDALPLLGLADHVQVVTVTDDPARTTDRELREVVRHLARHGIDATPKTLITAGDVANTLLSHIADSGADLLIMGGYGHSRMRERMMGGATRDILRAMTAPVLMAR